MGVIARWFSILWITQGPLDDHRLYNHNAGMNSSSSLRDIRIAKGLTQVELARKSGVTQQCISLIERGGMNPSPSTLSRLAQALSVPVEHLAESAEPVAA